MDYWSYNNDFKIEKYINIKYLLNKMKTQINNLKDEILDLLIEYPYGLTMAKIANHFNMTTYMLIKELSVLESLDKIKIINVGASKLILRK